MTGKVWSLAQQCSLRNCSHLDGAGRGWRDHHWPMFPQTSPWQHQINNLVMWHHCIQYFPTFQKWWPINWIAGSKHWIWYLIICFFYWIGWHPWAGLCPITSSSVLGASTSIHPYGDGASQLNDRKEFCAYGKHSHHWVFSYSQTKQSSVPSPQIPTHCDWSPQVTRLFHSNKL